MWKVLCAAGLPALRRARPILGEWGRHVGVAMVTGIVGGGIGLMDGPWSCRVGSVGSSQESEVGVEVVARDGYALVRLASANSIFDAKRRRSLTRTQCRRP